MQENNRKMAVLVADAFQDSEFFLPKVEIQKAGIDIEIVSTQAGLVDMWSFFDSIGSIAVDKPISEAKADDYVGILIPGGAKSPGTLSDDEDVLNFVKAINEQGKLVACICRGALLVANAGVAVGRNITGFRDDTKWPELAIHDTVEEKGGIWHDDKPVVVDDNIISSRHPDDAPDFTDAITKWLS